MIEPRTTRGIGPQLSTNNRLLSLGDSIRAFADKTGDTIEQVHRNVSFKLFRAIVYATPVDTGLARGSWIPSAGAPVLGGTALDAPATVEARIQSVVESATTDDILFLSNNVEYIIPLEYGWSQRQAPEGMVRINVARFQSMINEAVREAR